MTEPSPRLSGPAERDLASLATVVVFPRERFAFTERSIRSIDANTPKGVRILYIDAGSPDYVVTRLREGFPEERLSIISTGRDMCPHECWNVGADTADTRYIAFMENATLVRPHWLHHLVDCAEATGADAVNPLCLLSEGNEEMVHFSGGHLEVTEDAAGRHFRSVFHPPFDVPYSEDLGRGLPRAETGFVEPHCFLVRTERLPEFGRFDEKVKSVYEHYDFSLTVLKHGGKMHIDPASVICYRTDGDWFASDVPFFRLRWSAQWSRESLDHFFRKWSYVKDVQYVQAMGWLSNHVALIGVKRVVPDLEEAPDRASPPLAQTNVDLYRQLSALRFDDAELASVRDAYEFAVAMFGGMLRASGRPFLNHLVGTASIAAAHGASVPMVAAALVHAVYVESALGRTPVPMDAALKREVRSRFGDDVEAILDRYAELKRTKGTWDKADPAQCQLPEAKAIVIRLANDLEDYLAGEFAYSAKRPAAIARRQGDYAATVAGLLGYEGLAGELIEAAAEQETASPALRSERATSFAAAKEGLADAMIARVLLRSAWRGIRDAALTLTVRKPRRGLAAVARRITQSQAWIVPRIIIGKLLSDPLWVAVRVRRRAARAWQQGKRPMRG